MKWYHGSPVQGLTEFNIDNPRFQSVEGNGLYLTPDYKIARGYAGSEGSVYEVQLKTQAIFDATKKEEFEYCLELVGKKVSLDLLGLEFMDSTLKSLISGDYQITHEQGSGLSWQVKNLLLNNEDFIQDPKADEKIELVVQEINEYLESHSIVKYIDKNLGLVKVCKDPKNVKIIKEIVVGTIEDEELL